MSSLKVEAPKAFVFDVFGTVVNWRQSLALGLADAAQSAIANNENSANPSLQSRLKDMTHTDWEWFAAEW